MRPNRFKATLSPAVASMWSRCKLLFLAAITVGPTLCQALISSLSSRAHFTKRCSPWLSYSHQADLESSDAPHLTILIPAYNEELRIEKTLETSLSFLATSEHWQNQSSILVVSDGSKDDTVNVVDCFNSQRQASGCPIQVACVKLDENQGKGAALAFGIDWIDRNFPASLILTTDADGSASLDALDRLYNKLQQLLRRKSVKAAGRAIWEEPAMVVGYRTYASAATSRLIFRWGFRTTVRLLCGDLGVKDSQCGFKLMTVSAARFLYGNLHLKGWSHDVEVLYRAKVGGIPVEQEPINWEDKAGSKLVASPGGVAAVAMQMFSDVVRLKVGYESGAWKTNSRTEADWPGNTDR